MVSRSTFAAGIGSTTVERIEGLAHAGRIPFLAACRQAVDDPTFQLRARTALEGNVAPLLALLVTPRAVRLPRPRVLIAAVGIYLTQEAGLLAWAVLALSVHALGMIIARARMAASACSEGWLRCQLSSTQSRSLASCSR